MYPYNTTFKHHYLYNNKKIFNDMNNDVLLDLVKISKKYNNLLYYWKNFFITHNIKVFLSWNIYHNNHIAINKAMNDLGGILAMWERSYHHSPQPSLMTVCDIMFRYGSNSFNNDTINGNKINYGVKIGFVRGYVSEQINIKAKEIKHALYNAGAKKIISYFDQHASDFRTIESDKESYRAILNLLMKTQDFGLVIKPKKPSSLKKRLGNEISYLLEQAIKTGRCYIFESTGARQSNIPVTLAAQCADLCIHGHLYASSAGVECALLGKPTLLLDREGFKRSSLYILGENKVIFTNWSDTIMAINEYFKSNNNKLGDWGLFLNEIDPFRDGKGAYRMGTYLHNLIKGFENGLDKKDVLENAAEIYCKDWGNDKIIRDGL